MQFDQNIVRALQAERSRQAGRRVGRRWLPEVRDLLRLGRREGDAGRLLPTPTVASFRIRVP
jgi:hypothetical protein